MAMSLHVPVGTYTKYEVGQRDVPADFDRRLAVAFGDVEKLVDLIIREAREFAWLKDDIGKIGKRVLERALSESDSTPVKMSFMSSKITKTVMVCGYAVTSRTPGKWNQAYKLNDVVIERRGAQRYCAGNVVYPGMMRAVSAVLNLDMYSDGDTIRRISRFVTRQAKDDLLKKQEELLAAQGDLARESLVPGDHEQGS